MQRKKISMQNCLSRKALYNVTNVMYTTTRKIPLVRQLFTDAVVMLIALTTRTKATGKSGNMGFLAIFSVPEQSVLINVLDGPGEDVVAYVWQVAVLDKKVVGNEDSDNVVKKKRIFPVKDASLSTCRKEILSLLVTGVPYFLHPSSTRAFSAKPAQSLPE